MKPSGVVLISWELSFGFDFFKLVLVVFLSTSSFKELLTNTDTAGVSHNKIRQGFTLSPRREKVPGSIPGGIYVWSFLLVLRLRHAEVDL